MIGITDALYSSDLMHLFEFDKELLKVCNIFEFMNGHWLAVNIFKKKVSFFRIIGYRNRSNLLRPCKRKRLKLLF